MKIISIGNALVDQLVQLDDESVLKILNLPKGSMQLIGANEISQITTKINDLPVLKVSGGSAANTIHGVAHLGNTCGFIGKVGKDDYGKFYENDLCESGVNTQIYTSDTVTGRAFTFITPDTERTFATFLGAAIELSESDLDPSVFAQYDILHVEGYLVQNEKLIETALRIGKENNLKISLDLASYNVVETNHSLLSRLIPEYVDIVFANEEEAKAYTGKGPEESLYLLSCQCDIAIVKIGSRGSMVQADNDIYYINAIPSQVLDTTGAGDQYAAGFLHGYSENLELEKCGKLGSLLAGKVIENYGARIPNEKWNDILQLVEEIKR